MARTTTEQLRNDLSDALDKLNNAVNALNDLATYKLSAEGKAENLAIVLRAECHPNCTLLDNFTGHFEQLDRA